MFVVGTSSTFITRVLIGCLPGSSGSTHTPLRPRSTRSPCVNAVAGDVEVLLADVADDDADVADRNLRQRDRLDRTSHGFRFHEPESSTSSCKPRQPPASMNAWPRWKLS